MRENVEKKDNKFRMVRRNNFQRGRTDNKLNYPEVWYASEKKVNSPIKLIVYDDKGSMDITSRVIHFKGNSKGYYNDILIENRNIKNVIIAPQRMNGIIYLFLNILLITYYILFLNNYVIILIITLVIMDGLGLWITKKTKWVMIEYFENNTLKKVYFANGSKWGWSGIFGGTTRIYESIIDRI